MGEKQYSFFKNMITFPDSATAPFCPSEAKGEVIIDKNATKLKKFFLFLGPGLMVSIGYMDPGNWATGIEAGSKYGYKLLFVVVLTSLSAMFIQYLCSKLGIVSGKDLSSQIRHNYSKPVTFIMWILAEIAVIATDVAEVLGTALALKLLFGFPIIVGILATALDTFFILGFRGRAFRTLESMMLGFISIIGFSFALNLILARPDFGLISQQFIPNKNIFLDREALVLIIGIIGATIMPHNLYLHSAIVQTRAIGNGFQEKREALNYSRIDVVGSLFVAMFINMGIMVLAGTVFHGNSLGMVSSIEDAHKLLSPILGTSLASVLFAIALLASGQSSTITGTIAAQAVLEGHTNFKIPCWQRRIITRGLSLVPALIGILILGEGGLTTLLIMSQVCLGLQLPFALYPLIRFTSDKKIMNEFKNGIMSQFFAWSIFALLCLCNIWMVFF